MIYRPNAKEIGARHIQRQLNRLLYLPRFNGPSLSLSLSLPLFVVVWTNTRSGAFEKGRKGLPSFPCSGGFIEIPGAAAMHSAAAEAVFPCFIFLPFCKRCEMKWKSTDCLRTRKRGRGRGGEEDLLQGQRRLVTEPRSPNSTPELV